MREVDKSFQQNADLEHAIELLKKTPAALVELPERLPDLGIGELDTLDLLAPYALGCAARLDRADALAHMDPPTPWITWATTLWNARLNQNLLHPATAPFAREAENKVIEWLTPFYGMDGGHMCSGSTIANITALWAARDSQGVTKVVASRDAHLSIKKAAVLLGLTYVEIPTTQHGQIDPEALGDLSDACLVLTAGTTTTGQIDPLALAGRAKWTHVDAAWAGPLRLSPKHSHLLDGINNADSIAVSAHKWFFQPKESAFILFRNTELANRAISFAGAYLDAENIGVQGSRGAAAIPLLATLIAWGKVGLVERIDRTMSIAESLAQAIQNEDRLSLWAMPKTGVTLFRPLYCDAEQFYKRLPEGMLSTCTIENQMWLRSVAANPLADVNKIISTILQAV